MLINTLIKLEFVSEKKGIPVLLVIVPVSNAPLAFGGFISNVFPGTPFFKLAHPRGLPKNLITLLILRPVLVRLVILPNATPTVFFPLKSRVPDPFIPNILLGFLSLLLSTWCTKNTYKVTSSISGRIRTRTVGNTLDPGGQLEALLKRLVLPLVRKNLLSPLADGVSSATTGPCFIPAELVLNMVFMEPGPRQVLTDPLLHFSIPSIQLPPMQLRNLSHAIVPPLVFSELSFY